MYFVTVFFANPVDFTMLSTLVTFPVLSKRNLARESSPERSLMFILLAASLSRTVLYMPSRIMELYLSPMSGSVSGMPPVRRYCWNLASMPFSGTAGWATRNSLKERGYILISTYLPEMYVDSSEESRYALDPVM